MNLNFLNPEQRAAVTTIHGPVMILAGAGTGKTRVITYRIANLLNQGVPSHEIIALTFTNKAAREMKERISAMLNREITKNLTLSTFHSFCLRILRAYHSEADLYSHFSIISPSEGIDIVKKSLEYRSLHGAINAYDMLTTISLIKNKLLTPEMVNSSNIPEIAPVEANPEIIADVYQLYETHLKLSRAIDFDDCILKFYHLLNSNAEVKTELHERYRYFLVDEFQDTNHAQIEVLRQVVNASNNICVVGDDDQSIYGFRGVLGNIFEEFERYFPSSKIIKLEQNYRCTDIILKAAGSVIQNNLERKSKTLWSTNNSNQKINMSSHPTDLHEARHIAKKCLALLGKGLKPSDIAVLYRANNQTKSLEFALREVSLPYTVYGGSSIFQKKEVKDFLSYFKLSVIPSDRLSFLRIINTPHRGIGIKTLERIIHYADENKKSPFEVVGKNMIDLPKSSAAAIHEFCEKIIGFQHQPLASRQDMVTRGEEIIRAFKLIDEIRNSSASKEAKMRKTELLRKLPSWLGDSFDNMEKENKSVKPSDLLDHLLLDSDFQKNSEGKENNTISLMTIHSSKGLEFHSVFICGLEEETLPHKNSLESERDIEEERRLFYVALTRAKVQLYLSYANKRATHVRNIIREPSRFLDELPKHILEWEIASSEDENPDERKKTTMSKLSMLKEKIQTGF
jgi:DNA helicase-2/ATP-dependent DNA helicase PcrA